MSGNLIQANAIQIPLRDESAQLCCFSPPYWKLRKYKISDIEFPDGWKGQLGLEPSIDLFLDHLMLVMGEAWRVLRDDGVCFVNIGDSFWSPRGNCVTRDYGKHQRGEKGVGLPLYRGNKNDNSDIKPKSLCLIPQKFAIRCQEAGWIVRSEIIWHKLNPMPESCKDRPTKAHEQIWMLVKQGKYFFDQEAVKEQCKSGPSDIKKMVEKKERIGGLIKEQTDPLMKANKFTNIGQKRSVGNPDGRNLRSVWTLSTEPTPEAHFATWPSKLAELMIRAGSSPRACEVCGAPWVRATKKTFVPQEDVSLERGIRCCPGQKPLDETDNRGGFPRGYSKTKTLNWRPTCKCDNKGLGKCVVADIFCGVGTTVLVAEKLGRTGVGMDLSSEYLWDIAKGKVEAPMQKELF